MIDGHALHGKRAIHIDLGSGHVVDNHVEQRIHVHVAIVGVKAGKAVHSACVNHVLHGEFELFVGSAQVGHEVEAVVIRLLGIGARTVDLIDDDHDRKAGVDSMTQHEPGLGHRTSNASTSNRAPSPCAARARPHRQNRHGPGCQER